MKEYREHIVHGGKDYNNTFLSLYNSNISKKKIDICNIKCKALICAPFILNKVLALNERDITILFENSIN